MPLEKDFAFPTTQSCPSSLSLSISTSFYLSVLFALFPFLLLLLALLLVIFSYKRKLSLCWRSVVVGRRLVWVSWPASLVSLSVSLCEGSLSFLFFGFSWLSLLLLPSVTSLSVVYLRGVGVAGCSFSTDTSSPRARAHASSDWSFVISLPSV